MPVPRRRAAVLLACLVLGFLASTAAQPYDTPRGDTRLVVLGDFNGHYGATEYPPPLSGVLAAVTGVWRPDAVVFPGDVVAGQSRKLTRDDLDAMWRAFDARVAAPLRAAGVAYALSVGNHDASSLRDGDGYAYALDREAAAAYGADPAHRAGLSVHDADDVPFHYSFTVGDVFVAVIDASSASFPADRREWLAAQLASGPARAASARLVVGHLPLVPVFAKILDLPAGILNAGILLLVFTSVYSIRGEYIDMALLAGFGLAGFFLRRAGYPIVPILMGVVLGTILEEAFRRSLSLSLGDPTIFLTRPIAATLIALSVGFFVYRIWRGRTQQRDGQAAPSEA